jgi:hypothetical protein
VAFFAWKFHMHALVVVILTAGVVATWFIPRRFTTLCLGAALFAGAIATDLLDVRSEIGYTASGLTLVTGAVLTWRE